MNYASMFSTKMGIAIFCFLALIMTTSITLTVLAWSGTFKRK